MFRTTWELDRHVRHHAARIAADRLAVSPVAGTSPAQATRLRRSLGLALIRVGERLSERETTAGRRAPRPATAGRAGT